SVSAFDEPPCGIENLLYISMLDITWPACRQRNFKAAGRELAAEFVSTTRVCIFLMKPYFIIAIFSCVQDMGATPTPAREVAARVDGSTGRSIVAGASAVGAVQTA